MALKVEAWLFLIVGALFAVTDYGYWHFSRDPTGTTVLGISVGLAFLIGSYMLFTGSRTEKRPEDSLEAEVAEGEGEYGFYSPHSWWPLWVGLATALTGIGVAVAWWLSLIGIMAVTLATIGMVFQYYRGEFSH